MAWTEERVKKLTSLWKSGNSASKIAIELGEGVSRNAVIGKIHRLGLSERGSGSNGSGPSHTAAWYAGGTAPSFTSPGDEGWTGTQIYNFGAATVTLSPA